LINISGISSANWLIRSYQYPRNWTVKDWLCKTDAGYAWGSKFWGEEWWGPEIICRCVLLWYRCVDILTL